VTGDPGTFGPQLNRIATAVDPGLRLEDTGTLEHYANGVLMAISFWLAILGVVGALGLLLALAGVYSVMSFAVARRTREIGVRLALGAGRQRIMTAVFSRAFSQVGLGVTLGVSWLLIIAKRSSAAWLLSMDSLPLLVAYGVLMLGVCLLACLVPALRALRIQPTEALRAEG
jgi:ABC-type antimicrobial peptide transport system permease subunit